MPSLATNGCSDCVAQGKVWCYQDGKCHAVGSVVNPCTARHCCSTAAISTCKCKVCSDVSCSLLTPAPTPRPTVAPTPYPTLPPTKVVSPSGGRLELGIKAIDLIGNGLVNSVLEKLPTFITLPAVHFTTVSPELVPPFLFKTVTVWFLAPARRVRCTCKQLHSERNSYGNQKICC